MCVFCMGSKGVCFLCLKSLQTFKGEQHAKSNFQAQLRHNRRYLGSNLEKHKFESWRHSTAVDKDS